MAIVASFGKMSNQHWQAHSFLIHGIYGMRLGAGQPGMIHLPLDDIYKMPWTCHETWHIKCIQIQANPSALVKKAMSKAQNLLKTAFFVADAPHLSSGQNGAIPGAFAVPIFRTYRLFHGEPVGATPLSVDLVLIIIHTPQKRTINTGYLYSSIMQYTNHF